MLPSCPAKNLFQLKYGKQWCHFCFAFGQCWPTVKSLWWLSSISHLRSQIQIWNYDRFFSLVFLAGGSKTESITYSILEKVHLPHVERMTIHLNYLYQDVTGEGDAWTSQAKVNLLPSLAADPDSLLPKVGDAEEVSVSLIPPLFLLLLPLNNNKNNNHKGGSCAGRW